MLAAVLVLAGCSNSDQVMGNIEYTWNEDGRSYTAIVRDDEDNDMMKLKCTYVGKKPEKPVDTVIRRDWKTEDTDFYHYTLENLINQEIELINVSFRLKHGKGGKVYDTKTQAAIDKDWGGHLIQPKETLTRRNAWVWGKAKENVLHKIYTARAGGKSFQVDTQLVYKRFE